MHVWRDEGRLACNWLIVHLNYLSTHILFGWNSYYSSTVKLPVWTQHQPAPHFPHKKPPNQYKFLGCVLWRLPTGLFCFFPKEMRETPGNSAETNPERKKSTSSYCLWGWRNWRNASRLDRRLSGKAAKQRHLCYQIIRKPGELKWILKCLCELHVGYNICPDVFCFFQM